MGLYDVGSADKYGADVVRGADLASLARMENVYHIECIGPDGQVKWTDEIHNVVTNVG